jgi:hypothetical protein
VVVCPTFDMATSLFQLRSYLLSDDLVKAANIEGKEINPIASRDPFGSI